MAYIFVHVLSRKMLHIKSASSCCQGPEVGGDVFFEPLFQVHFYFEEFSLVWIFFLCHEWKNCFKTKESLFFFIYIWSMWWQSIS